MNRLTALGGFDAKGPACFLLEMNGARLLLDLGEGPDRGARPDLSGIGRVDAVLISHGHADHVGALDLAEALGAPPIHATAPVRALAADPRLKSARDLSRVQHIAGLLVETGPAGHAPGGVWMRIGGPGGIVYGGDMAAEGGLFPAAPLLPARAAVLDCSYGAEPATLATQRRALIDTVGQGPCLLPVPPAGRGLDIAVTMLAEGRDVAICDELRRTAKILIGFADWLSPGGADALRVLLDRAGRLVADSPLSGVMLAAGANCGSGLSAALGPRALAAGVPVIPTGHLSQGAPATRWVEEGRARRIRWNVHPNLSAIAAALAQTGAGMVLPAFAPAQLREQLGAALPFAPWSDGPVLEW